MQRELMLEADKPVAEALAGAVQMMIEEARAQARRAIEEPGPAMHEYRRALRRAEAVLTLAWPFLRRLPRRWLVKSFARARQNTRIARDLDAVLPVVDKLRDLALLDAGDPTLAAVRAWLEACRAELASQEIVAWRLRKNVRALAGLAEIFGAAIHSWVDIEMVLESLRVSYRETRRAFRQAAKSRKMKDVHAFRRAVRRLRYQLELCASARSGTDDAAAEPAWLDGVRDLHRSMKSLARALGEVTDLDALRAIVDEAVERDAGFDPDRLGAVLSELVEGRIERVLADAARAFELPAKRVFASVEVADAAEEGAPVTGGEAPTPASDAASDG